MQSTSLVLDLAPAQAGHAVRGVPMKRNNLIKITVAGFFIVALLLLSNLAAAPGAFGDTGGVSQIESKP